MIGFRQACENPLDLWDFFFPAFPTMKSARLLSGLFPLFLAPVNAAVYAIDINDGVDPVTAAGWTGLTAVRAPGTSPVQGSLAMVRFLILPSSR